MHFSLHKIFFNVPIIFTIYLNIFRFDRLKQNTTYEKASSIPSNYSNYDFMSSKK